MEDHIHNLEDKIAYIDLLLANPIKFEKELSEEGIFSRYAALKEDLGVAMKDWEDLNIKLDEMSS